MRGRLTENTGKAVMTLACAAAMVAAASGREAGLPARQRRLLYNLDGDSCMTTRSGSKEPVTATVEDLKRLVEEITYPGSHVDTLLVCVNAQVMYYPTRVGTLRGTLSTDRERAHWPARERQRFANMARWFDAGIDPYAVLFAEGRRRGLEVLLTFRVNDAHGNDFLRTKFWQDHPEYRLKGGALDFRYRAVRDYVFRLIRESVERYDVDGLEMDFNRFPTLFHDLDTAARVERIDALVHRVRTLLDDVGRKRHRHLVLGVRVPTDYGRTPPSYEVSRAAGCDPVAWARNGWVDFVTVSEFLHVRYDLPIAPWKKLIPRVPIYGGIECTEGGRAGYLTPAKYRRAARHLWQDGADGIYLFNFFTTREYGKDAWEPPFEVLGVIGDKRRLLRATTANAP